jgi:hypothetical protein
MLTSVAFATAVTLSGGLADESPQTMDLWRFYQTVPAGELLTYSLGDQVVAFPARADQKYECQISRDGSVLHTTALAASVLTNYQKFTRIRSEGPTDFRLDQAGNYRIAVLADGKTLRQIEFSVASTNSGDPFAPKPILSVTGPWSKVCAFLTDPTKPGEAALVSFYSQLSEASLTNPSLLAVVLSKGGKVVAKTRPYMLSSKGWQLQEIPLYSADNKNFVTEKDLAALGGMFNVDIKIGEKVVKTFSGKADGQKLVGLPQSSLSFNKPEEILLPRTIAYPASSDHRAKLLNVYWLEAVK